MKLTKSCYMVSGLAHETSFSVNAGFVTGKGETLIIDSGYNFLSAQTILGYAKAVAPKNTIKYLINTEIHFDHILGNDVFKQVGATIIACNKKAFESKPGAPTNSWLSKWMTHKLPPGLKGRIENNEGHIFFYKTNPCRPDRYINKDEGLTVGGVKVQLLLTPGHTNTNISIYIPSEKVLYAGDIIYSKYLPTTRFGNIKLWKKWITSLKKIEKLDIDFLVPGHGPLCKRKEIYNEIVRHKQLIRNKIEKRQYWWRL